MTVTFIFFLLLVGDIEIENDEGYIKYIFAAAILYE